MGGPLGGRRVGTPLEVVLLGCLGAGVWRSGLGHHEVSWRLAVVLPESRTHKAGRGGRGAQGPALGLTDSGGQTHPIRGMGWGEARDFQGPAGERQDFRKESADGPRANEQPRMAKELRRRGC